MSEVAVHLDLLGLISFSGAATTATADDGEESITGYRTDVDYLHLAGDRPMIRFAATHSSSLPADVYLGISGDPIAFDTSDETVLLDGRRTYTTATNGSPLVVAQTGSPVIATWPALVEASTDDGALTFTVHRDSGQALPSPSPYPPRPHPDAPVPSALVRAVFPAVSGAVGVLDGEGTRFLRASASSLHAGASAPTGETSVFTIVRHNSPTPTQTWDVSLTPDPSTHTNVLAPADGQWIFPTAAGTTLSSYADRVVSNPLTFDAYYRAAGGTMLLQVALPLPTSAGASAPSTGPYGASGFTLWRVYEQAAAVVATAITRVKQRDDGLGSSTRRVKGVSSRQRSTRVTGYS